MNVHHPDVESLLDGETLCRPLSTCSYVSDDIQALPYYRKSLCSSSTLYLQPARKRLHHHKDPQVYADLPIFENPCPLCFLKYCRKALKNWLRQ